MELMSCPLAVPGNVMHHVVKVESSFNPYAIGVVGGHLVRQPKSLDEALATVQMLEQRGFNFSVGLAQVNRYNLAKYGLNSYQKAFETCANLLAGSQILAECHRRSGADWGKSFSCYYSGNFVTGFRHGYVQKIYASIGGAKPAAAYTSHVPAIQVVSKPSRRAVASAHYPVYSAAGSAEGLQSLPTREAAQQPAPVMAQAIVASNTASNTAVPSSLPVAMPAVALPQPASQDYGIAYPSNERQPTIAARVAQQENLQQAGGSDAAFVF